jgi:hypothetical protein
MIAFFISALLAFSNSALADEDISNCFESGLAKNRSALEAEGFVRNEAKDFSYLVIKNRINGYSYWKTATAHRFEKKGWVGYATCHTTLKQAVPSELQPLELKDSNGTTKSVSVVLTDMTLDGFTAEKLLSVQLADPGGSVVHRLREEMNHMWTDRELDGIGGTRTALRVQISRDGKISALQLLKDGGLWKYGPSLEDSQVVVTVKDNEQKSSLVVEPQPLLEVCYGQSGLLEVRNRSSFQLRCEPTNGTSGQLKEGMDQYSFQSAFPSFLKLTPYDNHHVFYEMKQKVCE